MMLLNKLNIFFKFKKTVLIVKLYQYLFLFFSYLLVRNLIDFLKILSLILIWDLSNHRELQRFDKIWFRCGIWRLIFHFFMSLHHLTYSLQSYFGCEGWAKNGIPMAELIAYKTNVVLKILEVQFEIHRLTRFHSHLNRCCVWGIDHAWGE